MSTHIPTANPLVRYQIAGGPYGYHVTRSRYDGTRWMLQLAYRVAAPTYEQARGIAARLAATEHTERTDAALESRSVAENASEMPCDTSEGANRQSGSRNTQSASLRGAEKGGRG
jgi:hypothetical protein